MLAFASPPFQAPKVAPAATPAEVEPPPLNIVFRINPVPAAHATALGTVFQKRLLKMPPNLPPPLSTLSEIMPARKDTTVTSGKGGSAGSRRVGHGPESWLPPE